MSTQVTAPEIETTGDTVLHNARKDDDAHMLENVDNALQKGEKVIMKSELDHMGVWQAAAVYKRVTLLCMLGAFSASLDGYRECLGAIRARAHLMQKSISMGRSFPIPASSKSCRPARPL